MLSFRACAALTAALLGACATEDMTQPDAGPPLTDAIWPAAIRTGDVIVLVPGTGAKDYLATPIEALPGDVPLVDVRASAPVASDAIVFEQAIAAANRAGITNAELAAGALTFELWGAGFTRVQAFDYLSFEGLRIRVNVLGGTNQCATGLIFSNLLKYSKDNVALDATDLYARTQAWLAANPSATGAARHVVVASHSYGGAIAEYLAFEHASFEASAGPLPGGASMPLTVAAGVPAFLLGNYNFPGPGLRGYTDRWVYEVDRPDDPVHAMNPSGNPDGHDYDILFGDAYQGSYGISTEALSCQHVEGICPAHS